MKIFFPHSQVRTERLLQANHPQSWLLKLFYQPLVFRTLNHSHLEGWLVLMATEVTRRRNERPFTAMI